MSISETEERNDSLVKKVTGDLKLKFRKGGCTYEFFDLSQSDKMNLVPTFAFVNDIYIPKYLLDENYISDNCHVSVKAIISKGKWRSFELRII